MFQKEINDSNDSNKKNISSKTRNIILINILAFYITPLCILVFSKVIRYIIFICLFLCINPIYIFISNIVAGINKRYKWFLPLISVIMEIPVILIIANASEIFNVFKFTSIISVFYIFIGYIGLTLGFIITLIYNKIKNKRDNDKNN